MNEIGTKNIETSRLLLRRFKMEDAEAMYNNWASDPLVTKYLTWLTHENISVTRMLLDEWIKKYEDGDYFNWAIEYKKTGQVIGNISVVRLDKDIKACEMGYCMCRTYWGQGIMPEALKTVIDFLFDEVKMNRIAAGHDANNPKSGRVMEKTGMKKEGILRQAGKNNCGVCDEVWYAMVKSDRQIK